MQFQVFFTQTAQKYPLPTKAEELCVFIDSIREKLSVNANLEDEEHKQLREDADYWVLWFGKHAIFYEIENDRKVRVLLIGEKVQPCIESEPITEFPNQVSDIFTESNFLTGDSFIDKEISEFCANENLIDFLAKASREGRDISFKVIESQQAVINAFAENLINVRLSVAGNPDMSSKVLSDLAKDQHDNVRRQVAENPNAPGEILVKLAEDDDYFVRAGVAKNSSTPSQILSQLAESSWNVLRHEVAKNLKTPSDVLAKLAEDSESYIRYAVARNLNTPSEVLAKLAEDKIGGIRREVAKNLKTSCDVLAKLSQDEDPNVLSCVAKNTNTASDILVKLAESDNSYVRSSVTKNPNISSELLIELVNDKEVFTWLEGER